MAIFRGSILSLSVLAAVSKLIYLLLKIIPIALVILYISRGVQSHTINRYNLVLRGPPSRPLAEHDLPGAGLEEEPGIAPQSGPHIRPQEPQTNIDGNSILTDISATDILGSTEWETKKLGQF